MINSLVLAAASFPQCPGNVCVTDELPIQVFGYTLDINYLWATVIAAALVAGAGLYVARRATPGVPKKLQLIWESLYTYMEDQVGQLAGPSGRTILPLALCFFIFILICNYMELFWFIGGRPNYLPPPTSNVNLIYAMGLTVTVFCNYTAIKHVGFRRYIMHFVKNPLHLSDGLAKFLSLPLRLFGNVFAGSLILALIAGLFPLYIVPFADLVWIPFDLFIFAIQAFVFSVLTIVYYQQALNIGQEGSH